MSNVFKTAKSVPPPTTSKTEAAKNELVIGGDLDTLSAINALITSLTTISLSFEKSVKNTMFVKFVDDTLFHKKRADNFTGKGDLSTASCEMRKRSSRSYLNEAEVEVLKKNSIPMDEMVTQEAVAERFFFNPEIITDGDIAEKISRALSSIPELDGKDVILRQEPREAVKRPAVSEASFDHASKISDKAALSEVLGIISTLAIKPKLNTQDLDVILNVIRKSGVKI